MEPCAGSLTVSIRVSAADCAVLRQFHGSSSVPWRDTCPDTTDTRDLLCPTVLGVDENVLLQVSGVLGLLHLGTSSVGECMGTLVLTSHRLAFVEAVVTGKPNVFSVRALCMTKGVENFIAAIACFHSLCPCVHTHCPACACSSSWAVVALCVCGFVALAVAAPCVQHSRSHDASHPACCLWWHTRPDP